MLALAIARIGDRDEAEDLVQETLIAAWQAGRDVPPADLGRLLAERCHCWQACRRAARAALGRLIAAGDPLPPWLTGSSGDADGEAIVELVVLRLTIAERLRRPTTDRGAATRRDATGAARPTGPTVPLPAIPADLAAERPIAAALVRAGARVAPVTPAATPQVAAKRRRRRGRAGPHGGVTAELAAALARHDRLRAQLPERERAAERAARRLDELRRPVRPGTHGRRRGSPPRRRCSPPPSATSGRWRRGATWRAAWPTCVATPGLAAALARRERRR